MAMMRPHRADIYHEDNGVLPTCQCGWEGTLVPTFDQAADAYVSHRMEDLHALLRDTRVCHTCASHICYYP